MTEPEVTRLIVEVVGLIGGAFATARWVISYILKVRTQLDEIQARQLSQDTSILKAISTTEDHEKEIIAIKAYLEGRSGKRLGSGLEEAQ